MKIIDAKFLNLKEVIEEETVRGSVSRAHEVGTQEQRAYRENKSRPCNTEGKGAKASLFCLRGKGGLEATQSISKSHGVFHNFHKIFQHCKQQVVGAGVGIIRAVNGSGENSVKRRTQGTLLGTCKPCLAGQNSFLNKALLEHNLIHLLGSDGRRAE